MMSNPLPIISITSNNSSESSNDSSSENDSEDFINGGVTDVEDLDSQAYSDRPRSRKNSKFTTTKDASFGNDATDIEDYNDSESEEEERSRVYPELIMSLAEFLQNGLQGQALVNDDHEEHVETRPGDFLQAQNLNNNLDYITDCEDYDTDSEVENPMDKSVCVDLDAAIGDHGKIQIKDTSRVCKTDLQDSDNEDLNDDSDNVSVFSDISDLVSALSDVLADGAHDFSENEILEISGDAEVCQIEYSGSSSDEENGFAVPYNLNLPSLDVMFFPINAQIRKTSITSPTNYKSFLDVASVNEEVLTDVERLDDSAAEEDSFDEDEDDIKPIPRAVILAPGDDGTCQTDTEDIACAGSTSFDDNVELKRFASVAANLLPPVHREVVVLKESINGDTMTSVMPMDSTFQFGMYVNLKDEELTDAEDYSCADEWETNNAIVSDTLPTNNYIESEFIISSDTLKSLTTKRFEMQSNTESVTDIEEIFIAGTNRRKKLKSKSLSKGKSRLLDVKYGENEGGVTDVEDMDLSECGLPSMFIHKQYKQDGILATNRDSNIADTTDDDADGISDVSELDAPQVEPNILGLTDYIVTSSSIVHSAEHDGFAKNYKKNSMRVYVVRKQHINQEHTDSEDMQMTSDVDEAFDAAIDSSCCSTDLNEMLNESSTVVHEKTGNSFDVESEKLHIKGMPDSRDAHTDTEYVESSDEPVARGGN